MKSAHRPYARSERVGDEMRNILANIFISKIHIAEAGLLTVTNVKVTDDLKIAKIYISFLKNKIMVDGLMKVLKERNKIIRYYVGLELQLKYIPELRFYHDDTMENAEKIDRLIHKIHNDD